MTIAPDKLSDPTVRSLVAAINSHDRQAFLDLLTPDATMSDDGSDRNLHEWIDREIFSAEGHIDVRTESDGGRSLIADYSNSVWGRMRTSWSFVVANGRISRFETGQA